MYDFYNTARPYGHQGAVAAVAVEPVRVKRRHGLGNVVCLLPVLDKLAAQGRQIEVITNEKWVGVFRILRPDYLWFAEAENQELIDLDEMTEIRRPTEHRSEELGRLLGVDGPFAAPKIIIPQSWETPFERYRNGIIFAPEGGHPSRNWPTDKAVRLGERLKGSKLTLAGLEQQEKIPCVFDTRGKLELHELLGMLAVAKMVITMDSGILHLAAALGKPTLAIFGGIDPAFRIHPRQPVVALQTDLPCCPCNKNETCAGQFTCIKQIKVPQVISTLEMAQTAAGRIIRRVCAD